MTLQFFLCVKTLWASIIVVIYCVQVWMGIWNVINFLYIVDEGKDELTSRIMNISYTNKISRTKASSSSLRIYREILSFFFFCFCFCFVFCFFLVLVSFFFALFFFKSKVMFCVVLPCETFKEHSFFDISCSSYRNILQWGKLSLPSDRFSVIIKDIFLVKN